MQDLSNIASAIDTGNYKFTSNVKSILKDLPGFSDASLDWLMMEHYQFSFRNTSFLSKAAVLARKFQSGAIEAELLRNYNQERGHAKMYKRALRKMGTDVEVRREFPPTAAFFDWIDDLISSCPSRMLGAMYATETAAIFEHEVFWDVSREMASRRGLAWEGSELKAFHDLHLNGVEQSHKDELGIFLKADGIEREAVSGNNSGESVDLDRAYAGGLDAIAAMVVWWNKLLSQMQNEELPVSEAAARGAAVRKLA